MNTCFDAETANDRLHVISQRITAFTVECEKAEYTDVGEVWDLLEALNELAGGEPITDIIPVS